MIQEKAVVLHPEAIHLKPWTQICWQALFITGILTKKLNILFFQILKLRNPSKLLVKTSKDNNKIYSSHIKSCYLI